MLAALVERDGGVAEFPGLVPDDPAAILEALQADADIAIVSGGSSVGIEDIAPVLLAQQGSWRFTASRCARAARPGWAASARSSCSCCLGTPCRACARTTSSPAGQSGASEAGRWIGLYRSVRGILQRKITSPIGRLDYARVRFADGLIEPLSIGGASVLSSTTRADGFVIVGDDSEGFPAGGDVEVWLYA